MRTPIMLVSNDWHIKADNTETIIDLVGQIIDYAIRNKIEFISVLGDIFQSRQAQPLSTLKCFEQILEMFELANLTLICIPGNHDKTNYDSEHSFIDSFSHNPNLLLIKKYHTFDIEGSTVRFIPFFSENKWIEIYEESILENPIKKTDILFSHIAVSGSVNNDGTEVENTIKPSLFKKHTSVFLGHYHNTQKIGSNIYHLPSLCQNNFGENNNKGFSIIYNDGSFDIIKTKFKEYFVFTYDLENCDIKDFQKEVKKLDTTENFIRLKIKGGEDKIKAIKTDDLKSMGFDIKTEQKDINDSINDIENGNVVNFTESAIMEEFLSFCEKETYSDKEVGINYLNKKLNEGKGL